MIQQVVIFTSQQDPHTDHVLSLLEMRGRSEPIRLNTEEYPCSADVELRFDRRGILGNIELKLSRRRIDLERVTPCG